MLKFNEVEKYKEDAKITLYKDEYTQIYLNVYKGDEVLEPDELIGILDENDMYRIEKNKKNKHKETYCVN